MEVTGDRVPEAVISQRVRNRVIEYLEFSADLDSQFECEKSVPGVNVPYDVINQWEDWVHVDPRLDGDISEVYTRDEVEAMGDYHAAWEVAAADSPKNYPSVADVSGLSSWADMRLSADAALAVFRRRGKLPEE